MALCTKRKAKKAQKQAEKLLAKATKKSGKKADKLLTLAEKKSARAEQLTAKLQKKVGGSEKASKGGGKGLLLFGLLIAGAVAGAAAYKASRPVEDPWKTPAA